MWRCVPSVCLALRSDVSSNRKMLRLVLVKRGMRVTGMAEDGQKAVHAVRKDMLAYNVIFMDNLMPNMVSIWA